MRSPGYVAADQPAPIRVEGQPFHDFISNRTLAERWCDPEDLAGATIFLTSKASDFFDGQIIYEDGGILATMGKPLTEDIHFESNSIAPEGFATPLLLAKFHSI